MIKRGQNQNRLARKRILKSCGRPLKAGFDGRRKADGALGILNGLRSLPERNSRRQIERDCHGRHLALVIHRQRRVRRFIVSECRQRHGRSRGRAQVDVLQGLRSLLELRRHFHDDVILVEWPVHGRNLALPKRVVESIVQSRSIDSHAAGRIAIDDQLGLQSLILLVRVLVAQFRQAPEFLSANAAPSCSGRPDSRSAVCIDTGRCRICRQWSDLGTTA